MLPHRAPRGVGSGPSDARWVIFVEKLMKLNCNTSMKGDVGAFGCVLCDSFGHLVKGFGEKLEVGCSILLI